MSNRRNLKNFQSYQPDNPKFGDCAYLQSDEGIDWYNAQSLFAPETLKVVYDINGVIINYSTDISALYPSRSSVVEVDKNHVPAGLNVQGDWQYDGEKIINRVYAPVELQQMAEHQKRQLMDIAREKIAPLQDAGDLGIATDAEKSALTEWRKYRVRLNRINCVSAPDIDWPEQPE
ncbi:tail fiber assembly protein [Xenorhabdus bovienii]|uniref:tail fiber assembly protein n=1 Tax=Xenorhabdus bovienii TaxID=40576 RepID=UPI0004D8CC75|nr:tail fiber assembly protein [Xenorhabdus bovienii]CDG88165.1 Phage tail fiber assembly protein [Xenorhabdus bovienii str. feltiae France]CDG93170.1 Phage tail fiber assembly protein [Xenorhabdus bovienii str. feltiae Florida]